MNNRASGLDNLARELEGYADNYERRLLDDSVDPGLATMYRVCISTLRTRVDEIRQEAQD